MAFFGIFKAILTRLVFAVHGFISVWRVVDAKEDPLYWLLLMAIIGLLVETVVTLKMRKGRELKWFCPSVLFYLCSVVPSFWILQVQLHTDREFRKQELEQEALEKGNCSVRQLARQDPSEAAEHESLSEIIQGLSIPGFAFSSENWVLALQQILLGLLILGRWMLPKGDITRDQLSQLLLVYIGMAADILEFSVETLKEDALQGEWTLMYLILGIWSWSLLQFCLVLTATKARKPRVAMAASSSSTALPFTASCEGGCKLWCESEVWAITASIIMQDGPFLAMRMFLLIHYDVVSHMLVFFTCKNTLVLILQLYRLVVLYTEKRPDHHGPPQLRRHSTDLTVLGEDKLLDLTPFILSNVNEKDRIITSFGDCDFNKTTVPQMIQYQTSL